MDTKSDALLRKLLKHWANRQSPPANGREKLLFKAAASSRNKIDLNNFTYRPQFKSYPLSYTNDWSQTLFTWISENSYQYEFQVRLRKYAF